MITVSPVKDLWIVKPRINSRARFRLFCFPVAGGSASAFGPWAEEAGENLEICAIQFPGRQQRAAETPFTRMPLAVRSLEDALQPHLDLPFAFFGNCTGSLIAFELAQRLRRVGGREPAGLFACCCRAPHLPDRDLPIHALPENELWSELDRLGGTPPSVLEHPELKIVLSRVLRADFELAETYRYQTVPPLGCPITVFGGKRDAVLLREELDAWRHHTTAAFDVRMFDGGHYLMETHGRALLQHVRQGLEEGNQ